MKLFKFLLFPLILLLSACDLVSTKKEFSFSGETMGTTYSVQFFITDDSNFIGKEKVVANVERLLNEINASMSTYQKDSEISKFNQFDKVDTPFKVSPMLAQLVQKAIQINKITQGGLDITLGRVINVWGFGPNKKTVIVPKQEDLLKAVQSVGINNLKVVTKPDYALIKKVPQLYVDLSAIAKGYGVDKISEYLLSLGIENFIVEIGGETRASGVNPKGKTWKIAIEKPLALQRQVETVINLKNLAIATSGNYRNYIEDEQGHRLSHIISPFNYAPIQHNLASISVVSTNTADADGMSTGLFVLGAEKALELAEKNHWAIFMIVKDGDQFKTIRSSEFAKLENK